MAANWKNTQGIASLGKRFVNQIWTPSPPPPASSLLAAHSLRRCAHASAYDKNLEEGARPSVVPDHMIQPESDKYWAPHPQTGVFGPVSGQEQVVASAAEGGNQNSALEEKAWFRPTSLEDLEKPHHV